MMKGAARTPASAARRVDLDSGHLDASVCGRWSDGSRRLSSHRRYDTRVRRPSPRVGAAGRRSRPLRFRHLLHGRVVRFRRRTQPRRVQRRRSPAHRPGSPAAARAAFRRRGPGAPPGSARPRRADGRRSRPRSGARSAPHARGRAARRARGPAARRCRARVVRSSADMKYRSVPASAFQTRQRARLSSERQTPLHALLDTPA